MKTKFPELQKLHAEIRAEVDKQLPPVVLEDGFTTKRWVGRCEFRRHLHCGAKGRGGFKPKTSVKLPSKPRKDELWFKDFIAELSRRSGLAWASVYDRLRRINFAGIKLRRINGRVIFVPKLALETAAKFL